MPNSKGATEFEVFPSLSPCETNYRPVPATSARTRRRHGTSALHSRHWRRLRSAPRGASTWRTLLWTQPRHCWAVSLAAQSWKSKTSVNDFQYSPVIGEIRSRFDSIAIWIATKIRFKHCAIRFKYHAIWYWLDSNFNDSIQETRDFNRNLEVTVEIEYSFSVLTTQSDLSLNSMQI